jgi:hypothetical protein
MGCLQRKIWFAWPYVISFLALGSCGPWTPTQPEDRAPRPAAAPSEPACTNWNAYDEDWHRRHCDVAIRWCEVGSGSSEAGNSGAAGTKGSTGAAGTMGATTGAAGTAGNEGSAGVKGTTGAAGGAGATGAIGAAGNGTGGEAATRDAGISEGGSSASVDAAGAREGGHAAGPDAGRATDGQGASACVVGTTCPQGTSCVTGSCEACPGGVCTCQLDDDCSTSQICDHDTATCAAPPPACTALTTEAACAARVDCTPIYGGMSCTNNVGSPCHSGEANCTCETYSFAACVARD